MAQTRVWFVAMILAVCMLGCGGSEYRFGNTRTLPNLSGQWAVTATSQTMSQQFQGTANVAQTNLALQGSVSNLFDYCAPTATISGTLDGTQPLDPNAVTSYALTLTMQENLTGGGTQMITLTGSASADGTHMSGTYTALAGLCTTGDTGVWTANKN